MKKLIAILVVFALAMGAAFAEAAVSGAVFGDITLMKSDNSEARDGKISGGGGFGRVRLEASGANDDATFGAWLRIDGGDFNGRDAIAWWQPIDQLKVSMGGNSDGIWGKEGVTGWSFYQTPCDTNVTFGGENVWGWNLGGGAGTPGFGAGIKTRDAFYNGFERAGLMLEIKPMDILGINVAFNFFDYDADGDHGNSTVAVFNEIHLQFDVNLDFGNIALTYVGSKQEYAGGEAVDKENNGKVFLYAGINAIENVALDVGIGLTLPGEVEGYPIAVGAGAKITISEQFGLKARVTAKLGGDKDKNDGNTRILFDVLPYYALSDLMTVFVSVGFTMDQPAADGADAGIGFHFNPYITVGSEWGPKFLAGIKVWQMTYGEKYNSVKDGVIGWEVPIAIQASF